jgi:NADPH-dependent curcumin reductase CurA
MTKTGSSLRTGPTAETMLSVRQVRRPHGAPAAADFDFVTAPLPRPAEGQALVRNLYLSVDPYMREFMEWGGWEKGAGLEGRTLGRVIESREPSMPEGAVVFHRHGWSTHALLRAGDARLISPPDGVPLSAYLGILGGTGLTAWVGLTRIARLRAGEDIFISAAAGAVGSAAGRIARQLGARRIVGSTGSQRKARWLTATAGFDAAFSYRDGPVAKQLVSHAPDGIDVYFDNVGGDHLEAAIGALRPHGRVAWCGAVAQYNNLREPPAAPRNLYDAVSKSLRIEGYLVRDHLDARQEFEQFMVPLIQSGEVQPDESITDGFEHVADAFIAMLNGANTGKALIRLDS